MTDECQLLKNCRFLAVRISRREVSHGFAARDFAHLYAVGGRQYTVARMQRLVYLIF